MTRRTIPILPGNIARLVFKRNVFPRGASTVDDGILQPARFQATGSRNLNLMRTNGPVDRPARAIRPWEGSLKNWRGL